MTFTREEAARALGEMQAAERRTGVLARYASGGPILIAWGVEWLVCNLVTQFLPAWSGPAWAAGTLLAVSATVLLQRGQGRQRGGWRGFAAAFVILGWLTCVLTVVGVHDFRASDALVSLTVAAAYVLLGLWTGARYAWLGLGLAALIVAAYLFAGLWFFAVMGLGAGGSLILGGLWLRRA